MSEEMKEYVAIQKCLVGDKLIRVGETVKFKASEKVNKEVFVLKSEFYGVPEKPELEVKTTGGILGNAKEFFEGPKTVREKADALGIKYDENISDKGLQKLIDTHNKGNK